MDFTRTHPSAIAGQAAVALLISWGMENGLLEDVGCRYSSNCSMRCHFLILRQKMASASIVISVISHGQAVVSAVTKGYLLAQIPHSDCLCSLGQLP
jgi:hypothetical protein